MSLFLFLHVYCIVVYICNTYIRTMTQKSPTKHYCKLYCCVIPISLSQPLSLSPNPPLSHTLSLSLHQATNLLFMIEYGNPQLACGEAGYYLTTLEAAVQFIATLSPELLQTPQGSDNMRCTRFTALHSHYNTYDLSEIADIPRHLAITYCYSCLIPPPTFGDT